MKIKQLISELQEIQDEHGNLDVSIYGDTEAAKEVVVNEQPVKHVSVNGEF